MTGMVIASVLLSGIPVVVMLAGGVWLWRRYREERDGETGR